MSIYSYMDKSSSGSSAIPLPTINATLQALSLGIIIPAISAIVPIQRLLGKNLNESLNSVQNTKMSGMLVTIFDKNKSHNQAFVLFGSISVIFGTSVYYFLPKAFLAMNYSLLLNLFFMILSAMILGLTLLVNNLQGFFERLISRLLIFWETPAIRILLDKNLTSHRSKNKLTSIIYSLTLSCIVFLMVAADLQI